jgi:molybdopterin molybdotransferase
MLELEDALAQILAALPASVSEKIPLSRSWRRVSAAPIQSPVDLPLFDNSSMDGYAVRSEDVAGASAAVPKALRLIGRVAAGETFSGELARGTAVRLFTGSPLPQNADSVVMQEDTRLEPARSGEVLVLDPVRPWENVRLRGEDVRCGTTLIKSGERLSSGRVALLAATGLGEIEVGRRPMVGVLATGSELRESGESLGPGQIFESNRMMLAGLVESAGGVPRVLPIVADNLEATCAAMSSAFQECDIVITCGGVSVGEMDFVKAAFEQLGGRLQFWKVAIKPGKPFVFGRWKNKFLFGLPGNPVSTLVTFLLLARPALLRWQGQIDIQLGAQSGVLAEPLVNTGERRHFMRVSVDCEGRVTLAGTQASHILSSIAAAEGIVDVPPKSTLASGSAVVVLRWE